MTTAEPKAAGQPQSAAAPSPFTPIADYAFLSDCHTGALVAPDGAIDWLCVPSFDSPSIFGSLLDREAGFFRFAPFGINHPTARSYDAGTNVLVTTWKTPTGWVVVEDALTMGPWETEDTVTPHTRPPADDDADHMLVRTVRLHRRAGRDRARRRARLRLRPRPTATWALVDDDRHRAEATGAGQTVRLVYRPRARDRGGPRACAARPAGGRAGVLRADVGGRASQRRRTSTRPSSGSHATRRFWRRWLGTARLPDHRFRDPIQRSALTIKGLTYMPTGATVAALTTSLPETPGGERNWDYRYTWMRDTTFTLQALHYLNLDWEADEFMQFVGDLEANEDGGLQIMYGIDGRRDLTESTRDDLTGYAGARPVRIGNGAFDQRQNDVFGAVLDSILLHTTKSGRLPRRLWPVVGAQAKCATAVWQNPDQGIWEARGKPQHYVSSKLMCWVALDRAAKLAAIRGDQELQAEWSGDRGGDPRRHPRQGCRLAGCAQAALRHGRPRRVDAARGDLRLPSGRRRTPARDGADDRRRANRERLRAAVPHERDRRRALGQGGDVPHLFVLARLRPRDHWGDAAGTRPDGAVAARRVAARAVRRGVRRRDGTPPRQLPAGVFAPCVDRSCGEDRRRRGTWRTCDGLVRRGDHRHGCGRRDARPAPCAVGKAHPAARARRLAPARDSELARARRVRRQPVHLAGHLVRREGQALPAAGALLRRRRDEALRRRALSPPQGGLRRASPP